MNPDTPDRAMGAHVYEVEDLDLTAHGFPGLTFAGTLQIDPDDTPGVTDWHISEAYALQPDGRTYTVYDAKRHPAIFTAICAAVLTDKRRCDRITEASYEHGE
jgi:hypothetical protein